MGNRMVEKLFSNNLAFLILVLVVWSGLFLAAGHWVYEEIARDQLKIDVLEELSILKLSNKNLQETREIIKEDVIETTKEVEKLDKELDVVEEILAKKRSIYHRWRSRDMIGFCRKAQRLNRGWRCPNIDEIIEESNRKILEESGRQ